MTDNDVIHFMVAAARLCDEMIELRSENERLRKVVEQVVDTLTESAPSAPGVLATVALMRLALDPTGEGT
jgi:hypothetical protein